MIAVLGGTTLVCAYTTFRSSAISSFLKIFVGIFSIETIVFGLAVLAGRAGLWLAAYADYMVPDSLPLTVAIFSILVYLVAQLDTVRQVTRIADRYFDADERGQARIWPLRPFTALERRIAVAMVVFLVVLNQTEVGITVRLNFFNRDWFDAIQSRDAAVFWHQLSAGSTFSTCGADVAANAATSAASAARSAAFVLASFEDSIIITSKPADKFAARQAATADHRRRPPGNR
jgi:vitamin B12/bleomycin/antimicrobial peptide transport system ATP-binding/permease protein